MKETEKTLKEIMDNEIVDIINYMSSRSSILETKSLSFGPVIEE